jgi:hypothetical protein
METHTNKHPRILTPVLKALTAKAAINGLQECIESLGGVGYLENEESQHINVARLYRDANVLSIWEGTTNVLGTDFVKILKNRNGGKTLQVVDRWLRKALFENNSEASENLTQLKLEIQQKLQLFSDEVQRKDIDELVIQARKLMVRFAAIVTGTLMIVDVERDSDELSSEILGRFAQKHGFGDVVGRDWKRRLEWDLRIVFREEMEKRAKPRL